MRFSVPAVSAAVLTFMLAAQAQAQQAPQAAAPIQLAAADIAEAEAAEAGLHDIVVTATKRETNLQRTPISISVIDQETIKDRHVQSLFDLSDGAIPSLRITTFEARQSALTIGIRGIVPLDANQPAREQGVGIYIDGVYLGRQHGLNAGAVRSRAGRGAQRARRAPCSAAIPRAARSASSRGRRRASSAAASVPASAISAPIPARCISTCPNSTISASSSMASPSIRARHQEPARRPEGLGLL